MLPNQSAIHRCSSNLTRISLTTLAAGILWTGPLGAQESDANKADDYVGALRNCQQIEQDIARLECFDAAVGNIVSANDEGDLQVVDREDVRETRRSLFGFSLPRIGLFSGDGDDEPNESRELETTIESVRYFGRGKVRFTTAEGAVWEMNNVPRRMRSIEVGNTVVFRKASLGYFFVRINGQRGVKGRRVQ